MLFNSIDFAIFLPIVFLLYWLVFQNNLKLQNAFILVVSYYFYGSWDWRFLSLIVFSSFVDYFIGIKIFKAKTKKSKKAFLLLSLIVNLGFLGVFKYYNFFVDGFTDAFLLFGKSLNPTTLKIILPVGISFYTFQTLSYSIDIYRNDLKPTKDIISFFAFVSFFPQLVAGPIERASNLLPQFYKPRKFNYNQSIIGFEQILWGLFKKMVVADNLSYYVETIYSNVHGFQGLPLFWATLFFTFQIYCDFSGYSDIAIGTAKLLGFDLMINFNRPYFANGFKDFWIRWHISLSTWFRDYLYKPIGGNRNGRAKTLRNKMITFIVSGFWHGANWTFVIWGTIHGVLSSIIPVKKINFSKLIKIPLTFVIIVFTWVFFRANSLNDIIYIFKNIFKISFTNGIIGIPTLTYQDFLRNFLFIFILIVIEANSEFGLLSLKSKMKIERAVYLKSVVLILMIYIFASIENQEFIYFQF
jgi:D-alanyl-lipoteichoic acid acyltransferase DltB (MBOAT superfamily)